MNRYSVIFTIGALFAMSMAIAIPNSPQIGINTGCTSTSIENYCNAEHLFCIRSACSQCILRDPFNPFVSFCARLVDCVCTISNDGRCVEKVRRTCY